MADYPSEQTLEMIRGWDGQDPYGFFDFIESHWWMADWGFKRGKKYIYISTGGWSGNEDIIAAMQDNFVWFMCWIQSKRGGHYIFEIPKAFKKSIPKEVK
jgi:hypothetical protein